MKEKNDKRKTFIVDTSVLLYDKCAIHSFPGNDVVVPLTVLDELDRFKDKPGLLGEYARYVNRYLDDLRKDGSLHDGVKIQHDQTIRVDIETHPIPNSLDGNTGDNRIIATAFALKGLNNNPVVMVTKDINFRVKCDSLGIYSEDYYKDRIVHDKSEIYSGQVEVEAISPAVINQFYDDSTISAEHFDEYDNPENK